MQQSKRLILVIGGLGLLLMVIGIILTVLPRTVDSTAASASTDLEVIVTTQPAAVTEPSAATTLAEQTRELITAQIVMSSSTPLLTTTPQVTATTVTLPLTATPSPAPSPTPEGPTDVNGVPLSSIVVMPDAVRAKVQAIFAAGQALGRSPHSFSKLGDSTLLNPHFLGPFDDGNYTLGDFAHLQPTIEQFSGSFARHGVATHHGLHSWSVFDPLWADKDWCLPNEHLLACEFRLNNPSVLFVRLGSNDAGAPSGFRKYVRDVVKFSLENGVIPILGTKADRFEGDNTNNEIIRAVAAEYNVPLWDFDLLAETIPGRGLDEDQVHLIQTSDPHDYTDPAAFQRGHAMQDLTALLVLDAVRQVMDNENE